MTRKLLSKSVAAIPAAVASLLLTIGGSLLAQPAGSGVDCMVGTAVYPSIQSAVDAPGCASVSVPAGTFYEKVTVGRNLTIRGAGPERTTVDATGKNAPVFTINGPASRLTCDPPVVAVTLAGMTITGGSGPAETFPNRNGGGISGSPGVKLTVENSVVTGNSAHMNGGGVSVANGRLTIVDSVISRNVALANLPANPPPIYYIGGGGVRIAGCPAVLVVKNSVVKDNVSLRHGGGILSFVSTPMGLPGGTTFPGPDGTLVLVDSEIMHNTAAVDGGGGGVYPVRTDLTAFDTKVKGNYPDEIKQAPSP